MNKRAEAQERFAARRREEDSAPRLRDVVPLLKACKIDLVERRPNVTSADISHTRRVVVEHAPALMMISCGDPACKDGGYDITTELLRGLRDNRAEVKGESTCHGQVGANHCGRVLQFTATAEYNAPPAEGT